jgi:hypothetical protein
MLALVIAGIAVTRHAKSRETLTAEHIRNALGAVGFNPGSMRDGYVLRSIHVERGEQHGEFVVRLRIEAVGQP